MKHLFFINKKRCLGGDRHSSFKLPWVLTKNFNRKIEISFDLLARFSCALDMFGVWIARCSGAFFEWNAQVGAENRPSACQAVVWESVKLPRGIRREMTKTRSTERMGRDWVGTTQEAYKYTAYRHHRSYIGLCRPSWLFILYQNIKNCLWWWMRFVRRKAATRNTNLIPNVNYESIYSNCSWT